MLQGPESFDDVAVTFSEEEWMILSPQQKELHRKVMVQNYETMISLGYHVPLAHLLSLIQREEEEEVIPEDVNQEEETEHLQLSHNTLSFLPHTEYEPTPDLYLPSLQQTITEESSYDHSIFENNFPDPFSLTNQQCTEQQWLQKWKKDMKSQTAPKTFWSVSSRKTTMQWSHFSFQRQMIHMKHSPFKCTDCGKSFMWKHQLLNHQNMHTGVESFKCMDSEYVFKQKEVHQRFHTGGNRKHLEKLNREKSFHCTNFGKDFSVKDKSLYHQRMHMQERHFQCTECGKSFTTRHRLASHQLIHSVVKPYQCTVCGKHFRIMSYLTRHMTIHSGEKPFKCMTCGKVLGGTANSQTMRCLTQGIYFLSALNVKRALDWKTNS
ncbi:zinc finger protein 30-like [Protopterus annectens]|uniref:zinc finger protein 30-like n=1 Tax=Protopterus annectens TaxID=7888 RepID=UPI001CF9C6E4|nr:zinc finger protein 30-like [Protopterus annectens]